MALRLLNDVGQLLEAVAVLMRAKVTRRAHPWYPCNHAKTCKRPRSKNLADAMQTREIPLVSLVKKGPASNNERTISEL